MKSSLSIFLALILATNSWAADYKLASPGYHYQFPRDDFDHPAYQTEWWYYTGNLNSSTGHRFGFELTFFRHGIARDGDKSPWHVRDLYMAHLALSDLSGGRFYHAERINRAGPGTAGVSEQSGLIWNGNWQAQFTGDRQTLRAVSDMFALQLDLKPAKPRVIHGRDGISQKAEGTGHASHYISITRLLTSGSIVLDGTAYQMEGTSWMDHEFFSEAMDSSESGWDWLSVQFDDNTELMLYRMRHKDGTTDPYSSGTYIDEQGEGHYLDSQDFSMNPINKSWTSLQTKATYPISWLVRIPSLGLTLEVATPLPDQELTGIGPAYWEGAIDITGQKAGRPTRGVGYLEMTGYSATSPVQPRSSEDGSF